MAQTKILLDTNTYLRLAQSIRPLLAVPFGKDDYALYIHKEIESELNKSPRLLTQFHWVEINEYRENRKKKLVLRKETQAEIELTFDFISDYQRDEKLELSRIDIYCIATALDADVLLVTDDQNMIKTCREFNVKVCSTLELMKLMLDNNFVNNDKIIEIVEYWKYEKDEPANFKKELKKYFSKLVKK